VPSAGSQRRDAGVRGATAPSTPPRRLLAAAVALAFFWSAIGVFAVHARMPPNVVTLPAENLIRPVISVLFPEGWAFFTRDPQLERVMPLVRQSDGSWQTRWLGPHSEPRNLFGIDRSSKAQGVELGLLIGAIPQSEAKSCDVGPMTCVETSAPSRTIANTSPDPTICGDVAIVFQKPVPWAWSGARVAVIMPSRIMRVSVEC